MTKNILVLVLCIMISSTILSTGCTKEQGVKAAKPVVSNNIQTVNTKSNDIQSINTKKDIQAALENNKQVKNITWCKDNLQAAFTKNIGELEKQLYIWKVGEEKEKEIEGVSGNLYDIIWSPDKKYFTVNEGTSSIYQTILVSSQDLQIIDRVDNADGPVWSSNSRKIAFAVLNDKEPSISIELSGTYDLMIYDIQSMRKAVVLKADNDFLYVPKSWDDNGLKYEKNYLDDRKPEELIYENAGYDITTEIQIEKNESMEVETKYPIIINMENKDVENKINNIIIEKTGINKKLVELDDETFKETLYTDYEVTKKTKDILSIYFFSSAYMEGAAHPSRYIDSATFDLKTGKALELKDLFKKDVDYKNILNSKLNKKVNKSDFKLIEEYKGIEEDQEFYLKDNSLIVYYQEGIYTPYAVGPLFLEVPLDDIKDIVK